MSEIQSASIPHDRCSIIIIIICHFFLAHAVLQPVQALLREAVSQTNRIKIKPPLTQVTDLTLTEGDNFRRVCHRLS